MRAGWRDGRSALSLRPECHPCPPIRILDALTPSAGSGSAFLRGWGWSMDSSRLGTHTIGVVITMKNRVRQPVHIEPKGWGREVWLANNELYCGKILEINKGKRCSLHFHKLKTESFFLRAGRLRVTIKASAEAEEIEQFILNAGECMDIPPGLVHQMEALEDSELYEFSTQHFNSDSHRLVKGD
jgi:mannose-6-phosphate isomerase-like protein (cupin superfamily)